jgi:hypothetical protein
VHRRVFRPAASRLEDRTLLATVTWASDVSGDWDNPAMWTGGAVPGPGDDAVISFSDITVTHDTSASDTVNSVNCAASLDITSGSLAIDTISSSMPTSSVSGQLNLSGASLQLVSGTLNLTGGGTISGTINGAPGTSLNISDQALTATSVISSDGGVEISSSTEAGSFQAAGGTFAANTSFTGTVVSVGPSLVVYGVTFAPAVGGPVTLTSGALTVGQGGLHGIDSFVANGLLTFNPAASLSVPTVDAYGGLFIDGTTTYYATISGTTLNNYSSATLQTGGFGNSVFLVQGATINNLANASFTATGTGGGIVDQDNSAVAFNNAGTLTCDVSGGFNMSSVAVANTGSVVVQQGGLGLSSAMNAGTVTVSSGTSLGVGNYFQTSGSTVLNGGTINGGSLSINGGSLTGTGTINATVTNGGQVMPGGASAVGTLTINGAYTQRL